MLRPFSRVVVIEAVGLVPQPLASDSVHRVDDGHEVLEELAGDVLVAVVDLGQLQCDAQHRGAVERHPRRAIGLGELAAGGQRLAAVEDADVVQAEEAAGEEVLPLHVLAVHPPGEVEEELGKGALEEVGVPAAAGAGLLVDPPGCPGVHRRVRRRRPRTPR
jgi:hypothetical protein